MITNARPILLTALCTFFFLQNQVQLFVPRVDRITSDILSWLTAVSDRQWDNEQIQQETSLSTETIETEILSSTYEIHPGS